MCYSAKVQQNLRSLAKRFGAEIDWPMFEEVFHRRLADDGIKIARALESNFDNPQSDIEDHTRRHIEAYRRKTATLWEADLFRQKKRLADAQRSLKEKETKKARDDVRIATNKIDAYVERLTNLRRTDFRDTDERIFPRYYAPIVIRDGSRLVIRPMRYQCRINGKPANYDERYPGTYNALGALLTVSCH